MKLFDHLGLSARDNQLAAFLDMLPPALRQEAATVLRAAIESNDTGRPVPDPLIDVYCDGVLAEA